MTTFTIHIIDVPVRIDVPPVHLGPVTVPQGAPEQTGDYADGHAAEHAYL